MADSLRLFFALWPGAVTRAELARAVPLLGPGGRAVPVENLHVTLAFLGATDTWRLDDLVAVASSIERTPFVLTLDQYEIWDRALVVLVPNTMPAALVQLAGDLTARLAAAGFPTDSRRYRAHVTLIRERQRGSGREGLVAPQAISSDPTPIAWSLDEFVLVSSQIGPYGSRYKVLQRWTV